MSEELREHDYKKCPFCNKLFYRQKWQNWYQWRSKKFCSYRCQHDNHKRKLRKKTWYKKGSDMALVHLVEEYEKIHGEVKID